MVYTIQLQIKTLLENAIGLDKGEYPSFEVMGVKLSQWNFNHRDGWIGDTWMAEAEIIAESAAHAMTEFNKRIYRIAPILSLVGQAYLQYLVRPYLIVKDGADVAYFYYPFDTGPVGLMFQEDEKKALDLLLANEAIPDEFYLYWNDAVNTVGYSSKILIMLSALEALIRGDNGKKNLQLQRKILGEELENELFAQKTGLRGRLVHGEYFSETDTKNYVELIHKSVVKYMNDKVFHEKLISESTVHPHRHYFHNDSLLRCWIRSRSEDWPLDLRKVAQSCNANRGNGLLPKDYELISDKEVGPDY